MTVHPLTANHPTSCSNTQHDEQLLWAAFTSAVASTLLVFLT